MGHTSLRTKVMLTVTCENCGHKFTYRCVVGVTSSIFHNMHEKLEEMIANKEFGTHHCPECGYLQSWMWDQVFDDDLEGTFGCATVLPLWWWLSRRCGMSWWAGLILAIIIGVVIVGTISFFVKRHVLRKHMGKLAGKGYVLTRRSLVDLEKTTLRPNNKLQEGMVGLELSDLDPLIDQPFETEESFLQALGELENGGNVLLFKEQILRVSLKTREPAVQFEKPPVYIGEIPV